MAGRRLFSTIALSLSVLVGFAMPMGDAATSVAFAEENLDIGDDAAKLPEGDTEVEPEVPLPSAPEANHPGSPEPDTERPEAVEPDSQVTDLGDSLARGEATEGESENSSTLESRDALFSPFSVGDSTTPHAYFSVRQQGTPGGAGDDRGELSALIEKYVINPTNPPSLTAQSGSHPTLSVNVPLEDDRPNDDLPTNNPVFGGQTQTRYRVGQASMNVNALGVSETGTAYFAANFQLETQTRSRYCILACGAWSAWSVWSSQTTKYLSVWNVSLEGGCPYYLCQAAST